MTDQQRNAWNGIVLFTGTAATAACIGFGHPFIAAIFFAVTASDLLPAIVRGWRERSNDVPA